VSNDEPVFRPGDGKAGLQLHRPQSLGPLACGVSYHVEVCGSAFG
jgi:hypothetical protein